MHHIDGWILHTAAFRLNNSHYTVSSDDSSSDVSLKVDSVALSYTINRQKNAKPFSSDVVMRLVEKKMFLEIVFQNYRELGE